MNAEPGNCEFRTANAEPRFTYFHIRNSKFELCIVRFTLTLRHLGVTQFATTNAKQFEGFGFEKVWNPIQN